MWIQWGQRTLGRLSQSLIILAVVIHIRWSTIIPQWSPITEITRGLALHRTAQTHAALNHWPTLKGFPGGASGKGPATNAGDTGTWVGSLGREDPPGEGVQTHSSILAWRVPGTEEPGGPSSTGLQRVDPTEATEHTHSEESSRNFMQFTAVLPELSADISVHSSVSSLWDVVGDTPYVTEKELLWGGCSSRCLAVTPFLLWTLSISGANLTSTSSDSTEACGLSFVYWRTPDVDSFIHWVTRTVKTGLRSITMTNMTHGTINITHYQTVLRVSLETALLKYATC